MSLPHTPEILDGLRSRFCSFIIFMETMEKLLRKRLQQTTFPQLPEAPYDLGLVPYADLPHLDPYLELFCQLLHELPEIDPVLREKIEE